MRSWLALALAGTVACNSPPRAGKGKDLSCTTFQDAKHVDLCERISANLEWSSQGHDMPGIRAWNCTRQTVAKVVCSKPPVRLDDVAAAYAYQTNRPQFVGTLVSCLHGIQTALEARTLPADHPSSQYAVHCP